MSFGKWIFIFVGVLFGLGCELKSSTRPHLLVIAIEGLGFDRVPCQNETLAQGFATLCEESVRFTHAYTNSTNSLANLATLLTGGQFPWEHGLRGQSQWLKASRKTIAEVALENSYQTLFVSSGLPVLSKSGLGQGFENFDDRIELFNRPHFRPARAVVSRALSWMGDHSSAPMFSVLHFSDLLFPFEPSQNVENENRDLSVGSQLEEISEELNLLFRDLKRRHLWDNTIVVVAGLSGGRDPSSLKSDQTQVSLFIKPSRLKRDQATAWGVDVNVSLADVGVTLLEVLGGQVKENLLKERVTLTSVFNQPEPKWSEDRLLLAENYWSFENFGLDIVRSVRRKNLFYIHQEPPLLFNTLTDRNEQSPLPMTDNIYSLHFDAFREFLQSGVKRAQVVEIPSWFRAGVEGFRKGEWSQWESEIEPNSPLSAWVLRDLMENGAWEKVLTRSDESPFLAFLAHSRLEPRSDYGSLIQEYACSEAFTEASLGELSHLRDTCDQDRLLQYVDWIGHRGSTKELLYENRFRKSYQFWWARLELGAMNYAAYGALGIPLAWPRRPDISELFILHREKRRPRSLMSGYTSRGKYSL